MHNTILLTLSLILTNFLFGQTNRVWIRYEDPKTELFGYKDLRGNIKIPAKFDKPPPADSFYNIMSVNEEVNGSRISYYLLKDGREIGKDSIYIFDFTFDCESEGKILFKDRKKDRVGFFNKNGNAIIPAIYNYATPFFNGVSIAHKNAKRKCWGNDNDATNCEHWTWDGGESVLINEKNEILIKNWAVDDYTLNWYSMRVNDLSVDTTTFISIKGENENVYSFMDYEKEFNKWFQIEFLRGINSNDPRRIKNLFFQEITYWSEKFGKWRSQNKNEFLKINTVSIFRDRFQGINLKNISIMDEDLNQGIFDNKLYNRYYNSCGIFIKEKYPLFDVRITYYNNYKPIPINYQEHFEFIRTELGYKLLSVSLKNFKEQ